MLLLSLLLFLAHKKYLARILRFQQLTDVIRHTVALQCSVQSCVHIMLYVTLAYVFPHTTRIHTDAYTNVEEIIIIRNR